LAEGIAKGVTLDVFPEATRAAETAIVAGGHLVAGRKLTMVGTEAKGNANTSSAFQQRR
jgi:hypothetical protein